MFAVGVIVELETGRGVAASGLTSCWTAHSASCRTRRRNLKSGGCGRRYFPWTAATGVTVTCERRRG
eukprot:749879-Hanusia_phi.AAC.1